MNLSGFFRCCYFCFSIYLPSYSLINISDILCPCQSQQQQNDAHRWEWSYTAVAEAINNFSTKPKNIQLCMSGRTTVDSNRWEVNGGGKLQHLWNIFCSRFSQRKSEFVELIIENVCVAMFLICTGCNKSGAITEWIRGSQQRLIYSRN